MGMDIDDFLGRASPVTAHLIFLQCSSKLITLQTNADSFAGFPYQFQNVIRPKRQLCHFDTQRVGHRVGQSRAGRGDAAFAGSFDAEGIVRRWENLRSK